MADSPRHDLTERMIVLRTMPPLRTLPAREISALARSLREGEYQPGQALLEEHEAAHGIFLLLQGEVEVSHLGASFGRIRAPGGAGIVPFYAQNREGTRIVATEPTDALILDEDSMVETMEEHFDLLVGVLQFFASRLNAELRQLFAMPEVEVPTANFRQGLPELFLGPPAPPSAVRGLGKERDGESMSLIERVFFVRGLAPFRSTNLNAVAAWARRLEEVRFEAGETLWNIGDAARGTYFLVSGEVDQEFGERAFRLQAPAGFGGAEAVLGEPHWTRCVGRASGVALLAPMEATLDLFEDNVDIARAFIAYLATALQGIWVMKALAGLKVY